MEGTIMKKIFFLLLFLAVGLTTFSQNIGIGLNNPSETLDVNGRVAAKGFNFTNHEVVNNNSLTLNGNNAWTDFPGLSLTFSLDTTTAAICNYQITGPSYGSGNSASFLVTRLVIDGTDVGRVIQGNIAYSINTYQYFTELSSGSHTIKVQYRTPVAINYNSNTDWQTKRLQVLVFGSN